MFELAALGLLQREPLHGYRLKQELEAFMSGCISVNYGTIYPMLKRLQCQGAIAVVGDGTSSTRKIYSLTDKGQSLWLEKMMEHPQESWVNARSRFLVKFFFFQYLSSSQRLALLEHRLTACQLRLQDHQLKPIPEDPYQTELGRRFEQILQDEIEWLHQLVTSEKDPLMAETPNSSRMS